MRCPKCGYISFDHLESCKKCHKPFGPSGEEINGTTYEAVVPLFLKITREIEEQSISTPVEELDFGDIELGEETEVALRPGIDTEFTLDENLVAEAEQQSDPLAEENEELVVDLDDFQEVASGDEFSLDLEKESEDDEATLPPIDFGDLDISDLGPSSTETKEISFEEDEPVLEFETLQPAATSTPPSPKDKKGEKSGLEDLNFNGLDLDMPSKIVSGSAAGKRYLPSVKTGTALDKFDIDLGDLFSDQKKTKKSN